ncbi:uncharacterized protein BX663DRAFT_513809 [Cokeromyces recurvatus]|uniref:uncharacterized protein n=1 Tax=Cokeromyces recurvatus TaxID=90255 RepID=UPI0022209382|nr:uncharacterized protein BX663DRAFT_513809 [Cokeromyces recurvatus]KAI7901718.1 hypothetical protein BX663DRAFT_513809 [Cokeromyces recurvatus]
MAELAPPVLPDHVKKPNKEEHKKTIEAINANIERIQKQYNVMKEKIAKLPPKQDNTRREEILNELAEIRDKQAELKKTRKAVHDQLDAINESIRKKVSSIKGFQSRIPYKTTEEVDIRIAELERKIEAGVRIVEEKKMLQEITLLKRNRLSVEDVDAQQTAIDREREIYNELKKNIDESEAKRLSDRYEQLDAEFKKLNIEQNKQREARNKLYEERNQFKKQLDDEYNKLRSTRDEYRKNNNEYFDFLNKLKEYKREQEQLRKQQEEMEKRQEALKQELELASLPAFESEIALCDNLAIFLEGFLISDNKSNANSDEAHPNVTDNAFEGMVIKKRDDENFFVGKPIKKKQQKNKETKEKKDDSLKIPLATMEAFFDIKVTVPTKVSEIPATLKKLKERKAYYIAEQPKITELNKKKAIERIAAIEKEEEEKKKAEAEAKEAAVAKEEENKEE